ncbi:MAG: DUF4258 domain-containing protein [Candidatus Binatia bacterium]
MAERKILDDPIAFIRDCLAGGRILWTYHVNLRLERRFISREAIIGAVDNYELVEQYPDDKYFPSYLLVGRHDEKFFHALFATDVEDRNVRLVTAYYPDPNEWETDLKTRRRR